jgi:hypothetical protein
MERLQRVPFLQRTRTVAPAIEYQPPDTVDESRIDIDADGERLSLGWSFWLLLFLACIAFICFFAVR